MVSSLPSFVLGSLSLAGEPVCAIGGWEGLEWLEHWLEFLALRAELPAALASGRRRRARPPGPPSQVAPH